MRIFVDYLRSARGATAVAPFSTRARSGAPVATPVAWEELSEDLRDRFDIYTVPERLADLQRDPWGGFFELRQSITVTAKRALGMRDKAYVVAILAEQGVLRAETLRFAHEIRSPDDIGLPNRKAGNKALTTKMSKAIKTLAKDDIDVDGFAERSRT